ncbi:MULTISPECIES: BCCT family transporter [Salinicoccus]|uniref:BCCT family transporter n=1 Tax=Salinicoccus TaxID=45669 RepID=UPI000A9A847D|nr:MULTISPECIES: BCCT family transporter [Salinicoccus]
MAGIVRLLKDNAVLSISAIIVLAVVIWGVFMPDSMIATTGNIMDFITAELGWFYVLSTALFIIFCLYLGVGPFRNMKLGKRDEEAEYTYFQWIGMLFAAGMGVGLVFWGTAEPLSHFANPPAGLEPESQAAAEQSLVLSVFHWGIHPWAIYSIVALSLAFAKFRKDLPGLISSTFYPLIGSYISKWPGKTIDIIAVLATTVGIATSFGLSAMQFGVGLEHVFGLPNNNVSQLIIIGGVTVIFLLSVVTGISKGMKYLSVTNLAIAAVLLSIVLILGPTTYLIEHVSKTIGGYGSGLFGMTFNTTPYSEDNTWMSNWTLFYWAWLISWSPFVGTFIARVSKGRTLGEFMFGVLIIPTLGTLVWFVVFGGSGLFMELDGQTSMSDTVTQTPEVGLFLLLDQFPGAILLNIMALVLIAIFFITSANSATYVLGVFTSEGNLNPSNKVLITWGILLSSIASVLLLSGGLDGLQSIATITALPFGVIMIFMMIALYRNLRTEGRSNQKIKDEEHW